MTRRKHHLKAFMLYNWLQSQQCSNTATLYKDRCNTDSCDRTETGSLSLTAWLEHRWPSDLITRSGTWPGLVTIMNREFLASYLLCRVTPLVSVTLEGNNWKFCFSLRVKPGPEHRPGPKRPRVSPLVIDQLPNLSSIQWVEKPKIAAHISIFAGHWSSNELFTTYNQCAN